MAPELRVEHPIKGGVTVTVDATPAGILTSLPLNVAESVLVDLYVVAHKYTGSQVISDSAMFHRRFLVRNIAGTAAIAGSVLTPTADQVDAGLAGISITPSASGGGFSLSATGLAATNIVWAAWYTFATLSGTP